MSDLHEIRLPTTSGRSGYEGSGAAPGARGPARGGAAPERRDCQGCVGCPDRRAFLRVGLGSVALAALVGALPRGVAAAPVRRIRTLGGGDLLRYPIPAADGVHVDRDHEVILVRYQGKIGAFALSCPHQRSMLRWREKDGIFQCTKHHSRYSPMGTYIEGRATRNMDRLGIRLEGDQVVVDPSISYHSDEDPEGWDSAVVAVP